MIQLTRINGQEVYVNSDVIKFVEHSGDTRITFLDDTMILVREIPKEIQVRIYEYKRAVSIRWPEEEG